MSAETARLLAENVRTETGSDYAISITGVAGPDPSEHKPVGLVYIGLAQKNGETAVHRLQLSGGREVIRLRAAKVALHHLWMKLKEREQISL